MQGQNLEKRIFLRYSAFFVVLIVLVMVAGNILIYANLMSRLAYNQEVLIDKNYQQLTRELEHMNVITQQIIFNKDILDNFSPSLTGDGMANYFDRHPARATLLYGDLYAILGLELSHTVVNLYNENAFLTTAQAGPVWPDVVAALADGPVARLNARLAQRPDSAIAWAPIGLYWNRPHEMDRQFFSLSRRYFNSRSGKYTGVVQVLKPMSVLEDLCEAAESGTRIVIFDGEGKIIAPASLDEPWRADAEELIARYRSGAQTESAHCRAAGGSYLVSVRNASRFGYGMLIAQPESALDSSIVFNTFFSLLLSAVLITLCLKLIRMASHSLTKPLTQITDSLRAVTWDNMEMNLPFSEENSDLQVLEQSFGAMLLRIRQSMNLAMESRLREQEALYQALESQISPHFLYNTLSSISALADENEMDKVVEVCARMSDMLRYATDCAQRNSILSAEINYTRNFLELMKIRYEDRFDYAIDHDEALSGHPVPRLMLQTIVENCFRHAFPDAEPPWMVTIASYVEGEYWIVEVIDNGCGIDEGQTDEILEKSEALYQRALRGLEDIPQSKLGLINSLVRLRLLYRDQIVFRAQRMVQGSIVRFGGRIDAGSV